VSKKKRLEFICERPSKILHCELKNDVKNWTQNSNYKKGIQPNILKKLLALNVIYNVHNEGKTVSTKLFKTNNESRRTFCIT